MPTYAEIYFTLSKKADTDVMQYDAGLLWCSSDGHSASFQRTVFFWLGSLKRASGSFGSQAAPLIFCCFLYFMTKLCAKINNECSRCSKY